MDIDWNNSGRLLATGSKSKSKIDSEMLIWDIRKLRNVSTANPEEDFPEPIYAKNEFSAYGYNNVKWCSTNDAKLVGSIGNKIGFYEMNNI